MTVVEQAHRHIDALIGVSKIEEQAVQCRTILLSLALLKQSWFQPTRRGDKDQVDANAVAGHTHCLQAMETLESKLTRKVEESTTLVASVRENVGEKKKKREEMIGPSTIVLFHEGVSAHRVLQGHTEQHGRVVKCFEALTECRNQFLNVLRDVKSTTLATSMTKNSFEIQTFRKNDDLALPSLIVLRLVHSGVYLERITNVCNHAGRMSTRSPGSGRRTMAVVPMAYSDHEMDGDEDITTDYYDCRSQITANLEKNHFASEVNIHYGGGGDRGDGASSLSSVLDVEYDDDDVLMNHERDMMNHKKNARTKSVHGPSRKAANLLAKVGLSDMIRAGVVEPGPILGEFLFLILYDYYL
jgi:hypothetical protein